MPDLIRHPGAFELENILDSAKASLRARVKPGMTKNLELCSFNYDTPSFAGMTLQALFRLFSKPSAFL